MARLDDLVRFYDILNLLEQRIGGPRRLGKCHGRLMWPQRGVYFVYEPGEVRSDSGSGPRVIRVGTHAITINSRTTLWNRISQHRGTAKTGAGNHRGSIFRLLIGNAMKRRDQTDEPISWGVAGDPGKAARKLGLDRKQVKTSEYALETRVSEYIQKMSITWLPIEDAPGSESRRGYVERNAIGLLSNFSNSPVDRPSSDWLGSFCDREGVQRSGLWNNNHVDAGYNPDFLLVLEKIVTSIKAGA